MTPSLAPFWSLLKCCRIREAVWIFLYKVSLSKPLAGNISISGLFYSMVDIPAQWTSYRSVTHFVYCVFPSPATWEKEALTALFASGFPVLAHSRRSVIFAEWMYKVGDLLKMRLCIMGSREVRGLVWNHTQISGTVNLDMDLLMPTQVSLPALWACPPHPAPSWELNLWLSVLSLVQEWLSQRWARSA